MIRASARSAAVLIVLKPASTPQDLEQLLATLSAMDAAGFVSRGRLTTIDVLGAGPAFDRGRLERAAAVERILDDPIEAVDIGDGIPDPPPKAAHAEGSGTCPVALNARNAVGGRRLAVIAGPCSVEDEGRLLETAAAVAEAGAVGLRGGAFKPRTSPYSFQGLGQHGLEMLARARERTGLAIVTEVMTGEQIPLVGQYADAFQIGSRNMHNTPLLRALGEQGKPVLLKRGWSATLAELLQAAEYIRQGGNERVILCERGIRTFEEYVRNTLALAAVPELKRISRYPVIVDPSHGTGRADLVPSMSRAAVACGADGLLIEVHPTPQRAWSDGEQTLDPGQFSRLMKELAALAPVCGREL